MAYEDKTSLTQIGNSVGTTLKQDVLRAAGFAKGDALRVQAEPGRIVLARDDDAYDQTLALGRESFVRYAEAYKALAK